jgi:hypothetical protein
MSARHCWLDKTLFKARWLSGSVGMLKGSSRLYGGSCHDHWFYCALAHLLNNCGAQFAVILVHVTVYPAHAPLNRFHVVRCYMRYCTFTSMFHRLTFSVWAQAD